MPSQVEQQPMKLRLPRLGETTDDLIDIVAKGSRLAGANRPPVRGAGRYGEFLLWAHAPDLFDLHGQYSTGLYAILGETVGGARDDHRPLSEQAKSRPEFERFALMLVWLHIVHVKNGYSRTVVVDVFTDGTSITPDKILFIDQPDSDIWTDDERLVLKFARAAFTFAMTDDLFEAAREAWGERLLITYLLLAAHYADVAMVFSAIGLDRYVGLTGDRPLREQTGWPGRS